jgi:hypothetical protein
VLSTDTCSTDARRNRYIPNVPLLLIIVFGMMAAGDTPATSLRGYRSAAQ